VNKECKTPDCGGTILPQVGSARPRQYCIKCRPPRNRKNPRIIELPKGIERAPLADSYRKQLSDADRLDTPAGATVLHLALLLESGNHTAAGAASLSRELRAAMEVALRGAAKQGDSIDELTARRRAKADSA
jgi:hypothetical protein